MWMKREKPWIVLITLMLRYKVFRRKLTWIMSMYFKIKKKIRKENTFKSKGVCIHVPLTLKLSVVTLPPIQIKINPNIVKLWLESCIMSMLLFVFSASELDMLSGRYYGYHLFLLSIFKMFKEMKLSSFLKGPNWKNKIKGWKYGVKLIKELN